MEMFAMQEECRLEMMKFYIQSQNPALFEEIYHEVSYPDQAKKAEDQPNGSVQPTAQTGLESARANLPLDANAADPAAPLDKLQERISNTHLNTKTDS